MKNINFSLPVSEVCFPGKYSALSKIISRACHERETIVLVSIHQLPFDKAKEFEDFLSKYKEYKKINLIAALEGINTELYEAWKTYREEYIPINKICSRLEWQI
jgi:sulfatase maturation enzyme AslB (radical SAM superfamily)